MPIPVDVYTTVIGSDFLSQAYATIEGYDLFFFVTPTNDLRLKQIGNPVVLQLISGATWVCAVSVGGQVNVYYRSLNGGVYYFPFTHDNFVKPITPSLTGVGTVVTMSALYTAKTSPSVYAMIVDNATHHVIYTSADPAFSTILASSQVYNNSVEPNVYVGFPVMAIHHDDTITATINCQQTEIQTGMTTVGFYVANIPGVS